MIDKKRYSRAGPFIVEASGNPYLATYRCWLESDPSKVWEFPNARAMGDAFEELCNRHAVRDAGGPK